MQSFQKKPETKDLNFVNFEKDIKRVVEYVLIFWES